MNVGVGVPGPMAGHGETEEEVPACSQREWWSVLIITGIQPATPYLPGRKVGVWNLYISESESGSEGEGR